MTILNPYFYALSPEILAYENAWVNYINRKERSGAVIREPIWESWERCSRAGMDPWSSEAVQNTGESEVIKRISRKPDVLSTISASMQNVYDVIKGPGFMVMFCDSEAVVLKCLCDDELKERAAELCLFAGSVLREEVAGTNSVDLVVRYGRAVSLTGAEHYREMFHNLTSASAPLFDVSGNLLGVLSVWGRHEHATPHILGMVMASVKATEDEIKIKKINEQLIENNNQLKATLKATSDGVVYVKDKKITQINEEMMQLLGRNSADDLSGNVEDILITNPDIQSVLYGKNASLKSSYKVTLYGKKRRFNCIVSRKNIFGSSNQEIGQVLIFKKIEEITKLAKTVNQYAAHYTFDDIIGTSSNLKESIEIARKAAEHESRIVIEGESGTGKEMFAQAIHNASDRYNEPFIAIDCGAVPKELFESTLFGYEKGAFTGAKESGSQGAFELANKGTLFLDEIGNLPVDMQMKLLRTLQEKTVVKVGSAAAVPVDVRVIAATNVNLQTLVSEGTFREDLFYRLNVVYIKTPPLRERKPDIPLLVKNYLETTRVKGKKLSVDTQAMDMLLRYNWPGNIRQLFNAIERAGIMTTGITIKVADLPLEIIQSAEQEVVPSDVARKEIYERNITLREMNREYVLYSLSRNDHNITKTAKVLGITRATIYKMINEDTEVNNSEK